MNFDEYQQKAMRTLLHKDDEFKNLIQNVLGFADESGEVVALFKKWIRDHDADPAKIDKNKVTKELGDVLWYVAVVAELLEISMNDVANKNIEKLASRKQRGTLKGSGDDR